MSNPVFLADDVTGDRVVLYHISGCGVCEDCQAGYMISCHSSFRAAYGWQRDGGHAPFLLAAAPGRSVS